LGGIELGEDVDIRSIVEKPRGLSGLVDGLQTGTVSRRKFIQSAVLLGLSLASIEAIIAACGTGTSSGPTAVTGPPKRGGILKAAFSADPAGFDPQRGPSGMSHVVIEQVYSTLMSLTPDAIPQPELAVSNEVSSDGLAYTFKLRQGVKFHNGRAFTADDVKFTFERMKDPATASPFKSQWDPIETIKKVEAVDPLTVRFTLTRRTGPFLVYMAFPGSSIVPMKLVQSGHDLNAKPIGSGPFKFVSYEPRNAIKFVRNDNYFETGKPYFDSMEYQLIGDITALTTAVLSGQVNFSNEIPPKDWNRVKANKSLVAQTLEGSRFNWLLPNNSHKPFDDVRVRQAVSYALNRASLVDGAFFGQATAITGGVIPKWNWGYAQDVQFAPDKGDIAKAKAKLAEAGYPNGFTTSMSIVSSFPQQMAMAPIIQANLEAAGIKAKISTMEVPRYWDEVWGTSNFDITTMYWLSPLADPDDFVTNNYASTAAVNVQKYKSTKMDDLLTQAKSAPSQDARKDLYKQMQQLSMDDMPIVPLVNGWLLIAYSNKLQNYKPMRTGFLKTLKDSWFA
jgi:peptide/nickel transport system substrate-binding protein